MNKGLKKSILTASKVLGAIFGFLLLLYLLHQLGLKIDQEVLNTTYLSLVVLWFFPFFVLTLWGHRYKDWYWTYDIRNFNEMYSVILTTAILSWLVHLVQSDNKNIFSVTLISISILIMLHTYRFTNRCKEEDD